jgi:hypothetical protein
LKRGAPGRSFEHKTLAVIEKLAAAKPTAVIAA